MAKKPCTRDLILPCAQKMCHEMIAMSTSNSFSNVHILDTRKEIMKWLMPSSWKCTEGIFCVLAQWKDLYQLSGHTSCLCWLWSHFFGHIVEDMMCCLGLWQNMTSAEIFMGLNDFILSNYIDWNKFVGICMDCAAALKGWQFGLVARVKTVAPCQSALFTLGCWLQKNKWRTSLYLIVLLKSWTLEEQSALHTFIVSIM